LIVTLSSAIGLSNESEQVQPIRVGIIGLDTSHAVEFTKLLNASDAPPSIAGCRVTAAYPQGSLDIESSKSRIAPLTDEIRLMGVEIVDSIDELVQKVDVVLLETNDGRRHLEQALPVLKAHKRMFIDKPMTGSLAEAIAIFEASTHFGTPVFSSSAIRFGRDTQAVRTGEIGDVLACDIYSPCTTESTHPDLAWYGIHGVEGLFTAMKTGCQSVTRFHSDGQDVVVGKWDGGRIGTFRGMRVGAMSFGGTAFGTTGNSAVGQFDGYLPLVESIVQFFRGADPPVNADETIEILAFIEAADRSARRGGAPISVSDVITSARADAVHLRSW